MRLGVISDIHGVASALAAVLEDGNRLGVDRWWALGDLVLFGPHPVEVLEMLDGLDDVAFVAGNTDRYVLTDDQPHPHATPEAAAADVDLVRRYGLMAAGAAWTRGALDQAGVLGMLDMLPDHQSVSLTDGTNLLGVHASPAADDGPGFDSESSDEEIARLLAGVTADWVVGGHTHDPTDRVVAGRRVLNPGSVGLPRTVGAASWLLIESGGDVVAVEHRSVDFDTALLSMLCTAVVTRIGSSSVLCSPEAPSCRPLTVPQGPLRDGRRTPLVRPHTGRRRRASASGVEPPPSGAAFAYSLSSGPGTTRYASCTGHRALCGRTSALVGAERRAATHLVYVSGGSLRLPPPGRRDRRQSPGETPDVVPLDGR